MWVFLKWYIEVTDNIWVVLNINLNSKRNIVQIQLFSLVSIKYGTDQEITEWTNNYLNIEVCTLDLRKNLDCWMLYLELVLIMVHFNKICNFEEITVVLENILWQLH